MRLHLAHSIRLHCKSRFTQIMKKTTTPFLLSPQSLNLFLPVKMSVVGALKGHFI